jgi:hypothetical protein
MSWNRWAGTRHDIIDLLSEAARQLGEWSDCRPDIDALHLLAGISSQLLIA